MDISLHKKYQEVEGSHWWFKGRRQMIWNTLAELFGKDKKIKILDFGCNSGLFVNELRKRGHDVVGADVSELAIEYGVKNGINKLFLIKDKEKLPFLDDSFDAIVALDVMEHIEDDSLALSELKRVIKPTGFIIIAVPAFPLLWSFQDEVAHHFRRYTKKSLKDLFLNDGLKINRITFFNFTLFLPIVLVKIVSKFLPPKRKSDLELNNGFTNFILTKLFLFEIWILKRFNFPWGISLLVIAKK